MRLDARYDIWYDFQGRVPSQLCGRHDRLATAPPCLAPLILQVDMMRHLVARAEDCAAVGGFRAKVVQKWKENQGNHFINSYMQKEGEEEGIESTDRETYIINSYMQKEGEEEGIESTDSKIVWKGKRLHERA